MLPIPENISDQFDKVLKQRAVVEALHPHYRKWLRYFLDFSRKYSPPEAKSEQVRLFIEKLKSKKQTPQQCTQAAHAISLFFESQKLQTCPRPASPSPARLADRHSRAHTIESAINGKAGHPFDLVVNPLYGCGLGLFECLSLRVLNVHLIFNPMASLRKRTGMPFVFIDINSTRGIGWTLPSI
jgi:hypothetical protein